MIVQEVLKYAVEFRASDIHLNVGKEPWLRINGNWHIVPNARVLETKDFEEFYSEVKLRGVSAIPTEDRDFLVKAGYIENGRFRANAFRSQGNPGLVLRSLPATVPALEDLGLPPAMMALLRKEKGLILVTGATGSGKSTTMASIINHVCCQPHKHVITVEDPIEYQLDSPNTLITQRELGEDVVSFPIALRSAMREAPDVIMVGETRDDGETATLLLTAAETGHLVFSTLHTPSAIGTIERLTNMFPEGTKTGVGSRLAGSLVAVLSQTLLPAKEGGRVMACELLVVTDAVRALLRQGKPEQLTTAMQTGRKDGMQTMEQSIDNLLRAGKINEQVAAEAMAKIVGASLHR